MHTNKAPTQPEYIHHAQKWKAFMSKVNPVLSSINELRELNSRPSSAILKQANTVQFTCNNQLNISLKTSTGDWLYSCTLCY